MTEVNLHAKQFLQLLVPLEQEIVVGRDRAHLGESLLDADKSTVDIFNGYRQHFFQK